jgi:hypothetical protein
MNIGLIGGVVGSLFGVAGGAIGTYFGIKQTDGPRERAFMGRAATICWLGLALFLAGLFLLPESRPWLWVPYSILLPFAIGYANKRQMAIRREERRNA